MLFHKTFIQLCSTGITPDFATTRAKNYDPIGTSFHTWILTKTYIFVYIHTQCFLTVVTTKKLKKEILTGFQIISGNKIWKDSLVNECYQFLTHTTCMYLNIWLYYMFVCIIIFINKKLHNYYCCFRLHLPFKSN